MSGIETADFLLQMYKEEPIEKWNDEIQKVDVPNIIRILSAFLNAFLYFILPENSLLILVPQLMKAIYDTPSIQER